ncbi:MAG: L,D-transpeptidase, partial [Pseudolabrys sp.]
MRINRLIALMTAGTVAVLVFGEAARADLLIQIDKSIQRMTVTVDGKQLYDWPVSSGGRGYDTPSGSFKPFRMDIDHRSDEWDDAPMPYSIFFTKIGHAIHGTYEQRNLGRAVS